MRQWRKLPFISAGLVALNVIVFGLCALSGDRLYDRGGLDVQGVLGNGEYGRLLWAMFLHDGAAHLFNNMFILFFMGEMIERAVGHFSYGLIYLLSGVGGNALSLAVKVYRREAAMSIGASGAVFGLDGLLLALVLFAPGRMNQVTPARVLLMIAISLYSGFTGEYIDNAAHVGGLIVGFAAGVVWCLMQNRRAECEV